MIDERPSFSIIVGLRGKRNADSTKIAPAQERQASFAAWQPGLGRRLPV